jgi:hypothetical protein
VKARGVVVKRGTTWFYSVHDRDGKVVFADNTNSWRKIFDQCREDVGVARRVEGAGHRFQLSYPEIVSRHSA